jgi:hypothetical protein
MAGWLPPKRDRAVGEPRERPSKILFEYAENLRQGLIKEEELFDKAEGILTLNKDLGKVGLGIKWITAYKTPSLGLYKGLRKLTDKTIRNHNFVDRYNAYERGEEAKHREDGDNVKAVLDTANQVEGLMKTAGEVLKDTPQSGGSQPGQAEQDQY